MSRNAATSSVLTTELQKLVDAEFDHLAKLEQRRNKTDIKIVNLEEEKPKSPLQGLSCKESKLLEDFSTFLRTRKDASQLLEEISAKLFNSTPVLRESDPPPTEASHA